LKDQITLAQKWLDDASFNIKIWADRTNLATDSQTKNAELWLKQSQTSYEFAKNTKDLNLESLQNNLKSAQVALAQAQFDQSKLSVRAPIKWIIADID
jgi:multidrug resistance efflux pump